MFHGTRRRNQRRVCTRAPTACTTTPPLSTAPSTLWTWLGARISWAAHHSKRLVAKRASCLGGGFEPVVKTLAVELVLACGASLPGNGLRRQVHDVKADGAVLHAVEEKSKAACPHPH